MLALIFLVAPTSGQTASIGKKAEKLASETPPMNAASSSIREDMPYRGNTLLEQRSLIAIKVTPPKEIKVNDLITVIVRHQKRFEADSELENRKNLQFESTIDLFPKIVDGGIGASVFRRGKPNIDYQFRSNLRSEGDKSREDLFTTRLSGTVVDVKPNGNLVIQCKSRFHHEEEETVVTVTGVCRRNDVTPDNTVLSTQIADLAIDVEGSGAIKDAAHRGWLHKFLDAFKPF
jgi:flagellar L-ring protein precursor FlgH